MARIKRKREKEGGAISTASLPDIVFMLLFFFMVATKMRPEEMQVVVRTPLATELNKVKHKSLVSYIYIGKPVNAEVFGTAPRIQLNDAFAAKDDIIPWVSTERDDIEEGDRGKWTVSLKIDKETKMGIVTDTKQELRKAKALKILYSTKQTDKISD